MNIGDKVRFLDSVGGGRITGFQGRDTVLVEDEDGFEVPVPIRKCVVVDSEKEKRIKATDTPDAEPRRQDAKASADEPEPELEPADRPITYRPPVRERKGGDELNLFLCFEPTAQSPSGAPCGPAALSHSEFDVYFINDSNYFVTYTLLCGAEGIWRLRHTDTAEPNTKVFVETVGTDALNQLQHICMQALAFKQDRTFALKAPVSAELRLDLTRFYKPHLFRPNDFFTTPVLTVTVADHDTAASDPRAAKGGDTVITPLAAAIGASRKTSAKPNAKASAKAARPIGDEVVDLHIDELLDTTAGMTPADILEYQLDAFRKKMDQYVKTKGKRIVFIHGKGDGVLRNKITQELKRRYPRCNWQDASFREYGFGATLVIVH